MSAQVAGTNVSEFTRALQLVVKETNKDEATIINNALRDVAFYAMSYSDYADKGLIDVELRRDNIAFKIAARELAKKEGTPTGKYSKKGKAKIHGAVTRARIKQAGEKLIRVRMARSKAVRAGWIPSVRAFGGSLRGDSARVKPSSTVQQGGGIKASVNRLFGSISNALVTRNHAGAKTPVENIAMAVRALDRAVAFITQREMAYAQGKIDARLNRISKRL